MKNEILESIKYIKNKNIIRKKYFGEKDIYKPHEYTRPSLMKIL